MNCFSLSVKLWCSVVMGFNNTGSENGEKEREKFKTFCFMLQWITFKTQKYIQSVSLCQFVSGGTTSFSDHSKLRFNKFLREKKLIVLLNRLSNDQNWISVFGTACKICLFTNSLLFEKNSWGRFCSFYCMKLDILAVLCRFSVNKRPKITHSCGSVSLSCVWVVWVW